MLEYGCRKVLKQLLKLILGTKLIQSIIKPEIEVQKNILHGDPNCKLSRESLLLFIATFTPPSRLIIMLNAGAESKEQVKHELIPEVLFYLECRV